MYQYRAFTPDPDWTALLAPSLRPWCAARDAHQATMPALARLIEAGDQPALLPMIDGLIRIVEAVLGRPLRTGGEGGAGEDAQLLVALIADPDRPDAPGCSEPVRRILQAATRSARAMLKNDRIVSDAAAI